MAATEPAEIPPLEYTADEVAAHKSPSDNWMIIHGEVFDVSQYIEDHPGGVDVLNEAAGADATEAFENAGHSEDALEIMRELRVGALKGYKKSAPKRIVQVPRVVEPAAQAQPPTAPRPGKILTAAASVVAATLSAVYFSRHARIIKLSNLKHLPGAHLLLNLPSLRISGGFPAGFLAASTITALLAAASIRQLSKFTKIHSGFTQYPPHKPSSKPRQRKQPIAATKPTPFLDPQTYQPLPLIRKDTLPGNVLRLVFALPTPTTVLGLPTGQHIAIRATIDGKAVTRSYTPVSSDADAGVLELVVRCYPEGLLTSRYLAHLRAGVDSIEVRGPRGAMRYVSGWAKSVGMIAGGTGITPMYQVIRAICEDEADPTEVRLLYANRSEEDILLREELEALAERFPGQLKIWYLLDVAPEGWAYGVGRVTEKVLRERMPTPEEGGKVMVCGPPGMVHAAKGLLARMGFKMPGAAAKMEDEVFVF